MLWFRQPPCQRRLVIVNLKDDATTAIKGALWQSTGPWLVLRGAAFLKSNIEPAPIDGEVIVHVENVSFLQVLP